MKKDLETSLEKSIQRIYNKYNIRLNPMNYNLKDRVLIYKDINYLHSENTDNDTLCYIVKRIIDTFPKSKGYNWNVFEGNYNIHTLDSDIQNSNYINDTACNFIVHNNLIMDVQKLVYDTLKRPYKITDELNKPEYMFKKEVYEEFVNDVKYYLIPVILGRLDSSLIDTLEYVFVQGNDLCTAIEFKNLEYLRSSLGTVKDTTVRTNLYTDIDLAKVQAPRYLNLNNVCIGGTINLKDNYDISSAYFNNCYSRAFVYMAEILNNLDGCNLDDMERDEVVYNLLDKFNGDEYAKMFINEHFYNYETCNYHPKVSKIIQEDDMNKRFKLLIEYAKYIESECTLTLITKHCNGEDYIPHLFASVVQTLEDYSARTRLIKTYLMLLEFCKNNNVELRDLNEENVPNLGLDINGFDGVDADMPIANTLLNLDSGMKYNPENVANSTLKDKPELSRKDKISKLKATSDILDKAVSSFNDGMYNFKVKYVKEKIISGDPRLQGYNQLVSSIKLLNKSLIKQIRDIKTYNVGGKLAGLSKGKLDNKNLYKYQDTPNIFYNNQYKIKEMDLAFGILLDVSGSMSGQGVEDGKITMILLHETLKSLGINHCICTHNSDDSYECNIKKYQPFKEDKNYTVDKCYSLFDIKAYGGNCDSGALYYMQKEFARVRNKDKICIIFSDGEPTECSDSDLKEQVAAMERHGIRVIGIGINFESIKEYYPHNANGTNLKQMLDIVTGILKEYVLEKVE